MKEQDNPQANETQMFTGNNNEAKDQQAIDME